MRQHYKWIICCLLTTLVLWASPGFAEENKQDSSAIEYNVKEITLQCQELYADELVANEEDKSPLIEKCIDEKMEKLKKFAEEQG